MNSKSHTNDDGSVDSWLDAGSIQYLESMYQQFLTSGGVGDARWNRKLAAIAEGAKNKEALHAAVQAYFQERMLRNRPYVAEQIADQGGHNDASIENKLRALLDSYRDYGHIEAHLGLFQETESHERLTLAYHGLSEKDRSETVVMMGVRQTVDAHIANAKAVYSSSVGLECQYLESDAEKQWLYEQMQSRLTSKLRERVRLDGLGDLIKAEELEKHLGKSYVGQKRFSLEGCDSLIPLLNRCIETLCEEDTKEVVIGMAHRGRLNVMVNALGMPVRELGSLFEGVQDGSKSGDVKYHLGYTLVKPFGEKQIYVVLGFNPSHLEAINAVTMGSVRARQDRVRDGNTPLEKQACSILIHGDASIAGQGVVSECLNMAYTPCNGIYGTLHIVVNNQIGFTTEPGDGRSARYCTGIAKSIDAPVLHVNALDVDAVLWCAEIAVAYRAIFKKDIFIDMIGFRYHGHNESDDPCVANPSLYHAISKRAALYSDRYAKTLIEDGLLTEKTYRSKRDAVQAAIQDGKSFWPRPSSLHSWQFEHWQKYASNDWTLQTSTYADDALLKQACEYVSCVPDGFTMSRTVEKMHAKRTRMLYGEDSIDWGTGEILAYATLLLENYPVRLTGQDVRRGTFSHRHAVYFDAENGSAHHCLKDCAKQGNTHFDCFNSPLSEYACLGFEYGYAETNGKGLVIWEAQFGDFANTAQVVIDQFISSGWQKWRRMSGVVLLLPHGAEGQGPEHSSARLERFLQLCAQDNFQVCQPTTPAQLFHMLRRQVLRLYRRPLVCFTPKSLLRHPLAVSRLDALSRGEFQTVIDDDTMRSDDQKHAKTLVLCTGKVYYEILSARNKHVECPVPILRLEQIYPFPHDALSSCLSCYSNVTTVVWCQEEPKNQGAWYALRHRIEKHLSAKQRLCFVGRPMMSSPAEGSFAQFKSAQDEVIRTIVDIMIQGDKR